MFSRLGHGWTRGGPGRGVHHEQPHARHVSKAAAAGSFIPPRLTLPPTQGPSSRPPPTFIPHAPVPSLLIPFSFRLLSPLSFPLRTLPILSSIFFFPCLSHPAFFSFLPLFLYSCSLSPHQPSIPFHSCLFSPITFLPTIPLHWSFRSSLPAHSVSPHVSHHFPLMFPKRRLKRELSPETNGIE